MSDKLGRKYEGIITGVSGSGFYVQLPNTVEGLVRIASLDDDYYEYNPERLELRGSSSGRVYCVGLKVKVAVMAADVHNGNIEFALFGKNGFIPGRKKTGKKATAYSSRRKSQGTRRKHG
ncbi:MAG: S1 RNA-binding domain-containing protein [Erysipelotrichaceae bacterium]|nr:S1 RNA-binding domain-containing protein [Erysipelotrichaceae bacterium]